MGTGPRASGLGTVRTMRPHLVREPFIDKDGYHVYLLATASVVEIGGFPVRVSTPVEVRTKTDLVALGAVNPFPARIGA